MARALILRAETHEFDRERFKPLSELEVVLVYEVIERSAKRRFSLFPLSCWKENNLPEPEDFVGHLIEHPFSLDVLVKHWQEEVKREHQPVLAVDFDGVIAEYHGWKGDKSFGEPLPGVIDCLKKLRKEGWWICIWTTREPVGVWHYCTTKGVPVDSINCVMFRNWVKRKICANVYLDDRGLQFRGEWNDDLVQQILKFQPWWEDGNEVVEDFRTIPEGEEGVT